MPIIVETGQGLPTAESYASIANADLYHNSVGNAQWVQLLPVEKEQALRRATMFMSQMYRPSWAGYRRFAAQALDWPRTMVPEPNLFGLYAGVAYVDDNIVPPIVRDACSELAIHAAAGNLNPPRTQNKLSQQVGPIKIVYDRDSPQIVRLTHVDQMLAPYMGKTAGQIRLVRS